MATPALEADLVKSVPADAVLVGDDSPRHAGGRPLKLNVQRFLRICGWIQEGKSNSEACKIEQVDYTTFRAHVRKKRRWIWRYELADKVRDDYLRDFHLSNIVRHSERNWTASAWLLERKFPQLFALHFANRDNGSAEQSPIYTALTREQLLDSIRRSKELEAEAPLGFVAEHPELPDKDSVVD